MENSKTSYILIAFIIFYIIISGIFWYVSILGLIFTESWLSKLSILIFVILLLFPIAIYYLESKIRILLIFLLLLVFLVLLRMSFLSDEKELVSDNIYSVYLDGAYYNKYNPWNRITEKDWGII